MAEEKYYATGKRKSSIACVWMTPGQGSIFVNKHSIDDYFGRETSKMVIRQPLELTENTSKFDINVNVCGGGPSGQAGAIRHGITKASSKPTRSCEPSLKKPVSSLGTAG